MTLDVARKYNKEQTLVYANFYLNSFPVYLNAIMYNLTQRKSLIHLEIGLIMN